jgi:hypothetical protein
VWISIWWKNHEAQGASEIFNQEIEPEEAEFICCEPELNAANISPDEEILDNFLPAGASIDELQPSSSSSASAVKNYSPFSASALKKTRGNLKSFCLILI